MLKYGGEHFVNCLQQLYDKVFESEIFPTDWSRGLIIPLFKGGPEEFRYDPGKYRGITLLSIIGKAYTSILNERLTNWIDLNTFSLKNKPALGRGVLLLINFLY